MTRSELIQAVASQTEMTPKQCEVVIRTFLDTITNALSSGEKITISGFGTFERRLRSATAAMNPKTQERMFIPKQYVAAFKAGTSLKEAVKGVTVLNMSRHFQESDIPLTK